MTKKDGKAMMECPEHGLFETSIKLSRHFRKICSKIGRKPNRVQSKYSSLEQKVREFLESQGYIEGLDFIHNARVKRSMKKRSRYYWLDFYLPHEDLVIEVSPGLWHQRWDRPKSDKQKEAWLRDKGIRVVTITEAEEIEDLKRILQWQIV